MVLDENTGKIYFKDKVVTLSQIQSDFLSYLLNNGKSITHKEYINFINKNNLNNIDINYIIQRINRKTSPYFKIVHIKQRCFYIKTKPYEKQEVKNFLKEHKKEVLLLKKYKELFILKKEIENIKKSI